MRLLPSGGTAVLAELDGLEEVMGLYAALVDDLPDGVVDVVPAARTVLVVVDPAVLSLSEVADLVRRTPISGAALAEGDVVEVPVTYDGQDLHEVADLLDCAADELVRRHTDQEWRVAFCGFVPGFGYLTSPTWTSEVPRRSTPRTKVPPGAVGLAGAFSGVYPRASPGGWQLLGRTSLTTFDPAREPAALLRPGTRVRFVDEGGR